MRLLLLFLTLVEPVAGLTHDEVAAALRGEAPARTEAFTTATGKSAGRGVGAIAIERPLAAVWATLSKYEDRAEYIPRLEHVTVLDKQPSMVHARMEVDASVTTARYTAFFKLDDKAHVIHWSMDHAALDNTIADVDGEYCLFEISPSRTLVVYRTYVDAGRSVPSFVQGYMTRRSLPNLLHAVKSRVESGGRYHK